MFIQTIIALFAGIFAGIFTGLMPGIHVNLISLFVIGASNFLLKYFSLIDLCVFITAMSITHVFLDVLPSIFLGAPEAETALGVLPGHRYLLKGNGYMAVKLTIVGAFFALIASIVLFPVALIVVSKAYSYVSPYVGYFLIAIILFMILRDNSKSWAIIVVLLSGMLGIIVLNMPNLADPLFPMLSGLFGISTLLISLNESQKIPEQKIETKIDIDWKKTIQALLSGQFSGSITAILPGIGSSTAAVIAMQFARKIGDHGFMVLMGSINMVNFVISIGTLYSIDKARNGTIAAISEILGGGIEPYDIAMLLSSALVAGSIAVFLALGIARIFANFMQKVNYPKLVVCVIAFIAFLTFAFTGFIGLFVMLVSTAIGLIPAIKKVARTHAMACLTVPVIMYFTL